MSQSKDGESQSQVGRQSQQEKDENFRRMYREVYASENFRQRQKRSRELPFQLSEENSFYLFSTIISQTMISPLTRLSYRFQSHREYCRLLSNTENIEYTKNPFKFFYQNLIKQEGLLQLFRGNAINLCKEIPSHFASLYLASELQTRIMNKDNKDSNNDSFVATMANSMPKFMSNILIGSMTGLIPLIAFYPINYAHARLVCDMNNIGTYVNTQNISQIQKMQKNPSFVQGYRFVGFNHCLNTTIQDHGIRGIYRGLNLSIANVFVYRGMYFGLYESLKQLKRKFNYDLTDNNSMRFVESFMLAYGVSLFAKMASYPLETVRLRVMMNQCMNSLSNAKTYDLQSYQTSMQCFKHIVNNEGITWLYRGFSVHLATSVAAAFCLSYFDMMRAYQQQEF